MGLGFGRSALHGAKLLKGLWDLVSTVIIGGFKSPE